MNTHTDLPPLAPKVARFHASNPVQAETSSVATSLSAKQRRNRHTDAEWESHKDTIARLYVEEAQRVEGVIEQLKQAHSFHVG